MSQSHLQGLIHVQSEAFWIVRSQEGVICAEPLLDDPSAHQVEIQTLYSGFNGETERVIFNGQCDVEFAQSLQAPFLLGQLPAPVKYGESSVGVVIQGPNSLIGQRVFCPYPHQSLYTLPVSAITPIPVHIPSQRALLLTEIERALVALWAGGPLLGERLLVMGENTVAYLIAYLLHQLKGISVTLCAHHPLSFEIADQLRVPCITPEELTSDYDQVYYCSSHLEHMNMIDQALVPQGKLIDCTYFMRTHSLQLSARLLHNQTQVIVAHPTLHHPRSQRWSDPQHQKKVALGILEDRNLNHLLDPLETPFVDLPQKMQSVCSHKLPSRYQIVSYS